MLGIGTDLVDRRRIAAALHRFGPRFSQRLCHPRELLALVGERDAAAFLARRFAAKEAVAKALGTGIGALARLHEIEVTHDAAGAPGILLHGAAAVRLRHLAGGDEPAQVLISLSDEPPYALAFAVIHGMTPRLTPRDPH